METETILSSDLFRVERRHSPRFPGLRLTRSVEKGLALSVSLGITFVFLSAIGRSLIFTSPDMSIVEPFTPMSFLTQAASSESVEAPMEEATVTEIAPREWEIVSIWVEPRQQASDTEQAEVDSAAAGFDPYARPSRTLRLAVKQIDAGATPRLQELLSLERGDGESAIRCQLAIAREPICNGGTDRKTRQAEAVLATVSQDLLRFYQQRKIEVII